MPLRKLITTSGWKARTMPVTFNGASAAVTSSLCGR